MSRHRTIQLSKSKAVVLAAAGALSVATLAVAPAATAATRTPTAAQAVAQAGPATAQRAEAIRLVQPAAVKKKKKKKKTSGSPRQIAEAMLGSFGWRASQFSCLDPLWTHESGWSVTAYNSGSGAYGIPQALPGWKMASAGPDWQHNAATQIRWGLRYIKGSYGSPCAAWGHEQATGWY